MGDDAIDSVPWLSPDGMKFLFLRDAVTDPATDGKAATIMVANVDGTDVHAVTGKLQNILATAWSHDGSRIAVASDKDGEPALQVFAASGSGAPVADRHPRDARAVPRVPAR